MAPCALIVPAEVFHGNIVASHTCAT